MGSGLRIFSFELCTISPGTNKECRYDTVPYTQLEDDVGEQTNMYHSF